MTTKTHGTLSEADFSELLRVLDDPEASDDELLRVADRLDELFPESSDPYAGLTPYERKKRRAAERERQMAKAGREIGNIPAIEDVERRASYRFDLAGFCRHYAPGVFYLEFSPMHRKVIRKLENAILHAGLFAFAMPRGFGKTALCRLAAMWAVAYGHTRYVYIIGANETKAIDNLDSIKKLMLLPEFAADFPEITIPFEHIGGVANRASGQLCDGMRTGIKYEKTRIVFPSVPPPPNWPDDWELSIDGTVPTSGAVIYVSGLTGDGIRGSNYTTDSGEMIRPGLVLLDDPQTDESAKSPQQNETREGLLNGAVLGMEGPGEKMSVMMPCTIIKPDDMVARTIDRKRNPLWGGERSGILTSMPKNMEIWDKYFVYYRECAALDPPDYTRANNYYRRHRKKLDEGADPLWPERKDDCVSAIQFAMNQLARVKEEAFWSEYMNDPLGEVADGLVILPPADIQERLSGYDRGVAAAEAGFVEAMIDVHDDVLYWAMVAADQEYTGSIIDYGTWPEQPVEYFLKRSARRTLTKLYRGISTEAAVGKGIAELIDKLFGMTVKKLDGDPLQLDRLMIDQGYAKTRKNVEAAVRRSDYTEQIILSNGRGVKSGHVPLSSGYDTHRKRKSKGIIKHGGKDEWSMRKEDGIRRVTFDSNHWKTKLHARLAQPLGSPSALTLYGKDAARHENIAEHLAAEAAEPTSGHGRDVFEFERKPGWDNHWLDCAVGCLVLLSVGGAALSDDDRVAGKPKPGTEPPKKKLSLSERRKLAQQKKKKHRKKGG